MESSEIISSEVDLHSNVASEEREGFLPRLRRAVFDSFISLSQQHSSISRALTLIFHLFGFFQLILFPLSPLLYWRLKGSEGNAVWGFQGFLTAIALSPWQDRATSNSGYSPVIMFCVAAVFSGLIVVLFCLMLLFKYKGVGRFQGQILSTLLHVGLTAGTVPIFSNLVSPLYCRTSWGGFVCWGGAHLAATFFGVILTIISLAVLLLAALLFKSPTLDLKLNPTLMAHGRGQAAQLLVRAGLSIFFVVGTEASPWAHALVNLIGACSLLGLQLIFLEFFDQTINRTLCALHAMLLAGCVACILSVGMANSSQAVSNITSASLVWVFLTPMAAQAGWSAAVGRWNWMGITKDLSNAYIVELRVRYLLTEGKIQGGGLLLGGAGAAGGSGSKIFPHEEELHPSAPHFPSSKEGGHGHGSGGDISLCPVVGANPKPVFEGRSTGSKTHLSPLPTVDGGDYSRPFSSVLKSVDSLLLEASMSLSGSPLLHIFQSVVARGVRKNVHLERMHLRAASVNADASTLDIHFFVEQRLSALKEDDHRSSRGRMTVELRLHFETLQSAAEAKVGRCRSLILAFWSVLCDKHPDLAALSLAGRQIQEALGDAEATFKDLLTMAPTSVPVLRAFAAFNLELANNPGLAAELLSDADNLEEETSKAQTGGGDMEIILGAPSEIDLTAEGVALLRVNARATDGMGVGSIIHANISALKLFGYVGNKRELFNRDMSILLPEPIASVHGQFLDKFNRDGVQVMTGSCKTMFGVHRSGHIFPMRLYVYSTGDMWACALEEVPALGCSFLFVSGSPGFPVLAACRSSISTLGLSSTSLRGGGVSLTSYISDANSVLPSLIASGLGGGLVLIRRRGAAAAQGKRRADNLLLRVKAQEVRLPQLDAPLYILRMRHCSNAEFEEASSVSANVLGLSPGESLPESYITSPSLSAFRANDKAKGEGEGEDEEGGSNDANSVSAVGSHRGSENMEGAILQNSEPYPIAEPDDDSEPPSNAKKPTVQWAPSPNSQFSPGGEKKVEEDDHPPKPPRNPPPPFLRPKENTLTSSLRQRSTSSRSILPLDNPPLDQHEKQGVLEDGEGVGEDKTKGKLSGSGFGGLLSSMASSTPKFGRSGASVMSGNSSNSKFSRMSAAEIVRKGVALRSSKMEASLLRLRNSVIVTFLIAALINILSYIVTKFAFDLLVLNFKTVVDSAERAILVQRGVEQVQLQVFSNYMTPPLYDFASNIDFDFSNERIRTSVNSVEALNNKLYLQADSTGGEIKDFYLRPIWSVSELVLGSYKNRDTFSTTSRNISIMNFLVDYVAKQRTFWWYPIAQVQPSDLDTWWIENNGATTLMNALNATLYLASSANESTSSLVTLSNYIVLGVALIVFTLVALVAIIPAVGKVLKEQNGIYEVFAEVPVRIVRHLRDSLATKILTLKQAEEAEGEDHALDVADWENSSTPLTVQGLGGTEHINVNEPFAEPKERRFSPLFCCLYKRESSGGTSRRAYRKVANSSAALTVRMLWPVLFFCAFFCLTFWWHEVVNINATYFRSEVLWGAELQVLMPSVSYSLRNALVYNSSNTWVPTWLNLSSSQLELASTLVDALSYGSVDRHLRPALSSSNSAYRILLENGCVQNAVDAATCANYGTRPCNYFYPYNFCYKPPSNVDINYPVFYYGIVGTGLLPALRQYVLLARNLIKDRAAALASGVPLPRIDLTAPPFSFVDQLGRLYLPAGLEALSQGRVDEDTKYLTNFGDLNLLATLLCILTLLLFYVCTYRPLFAKLDKDIKDTRGLLLLLPEEAARLVPAVLNAGKKLLVSRD